MINGKSAIDPGGIVYDADFVKEQKSLLSKRTLVQDCKRRKILRRIVYGFTARAVFFCCSKSLTPLLFNRKNGIISITIILITVK